MKFNPVTKELFTNEGQLMKQLHCPFKMRWSSLQVQSDDPSSRQCCHCNEAIVDTALYEEWQLVKLLQEKPNTCLKIDLHQDDIKIITNGILEQR